MQPASSRSGVQQVEVDATADALLAQGVRPTVQRVRETMGRGSPNRVGPMLETWFAGLAPRLGVVPAGEGKPAGPPAAVRAGMEQLWQQALELAHGEAQAALAREQEALAAERAALASSRADAANQVTSAEQRAALLQQALRATQEQLAQATSAVQQAHTALAQREDELARARHSIADLVQQKDAAAREHDKQLQRLQMERETLGARSAGNEKRLLEEVDRARQETKAESKKVAQLETALERSRAEAVSARESAAAHARALELDAARLRAKLEATEQLVRDLRAAVPKRAAGKAAGPSAKRGRQMVKRG